MHSTAQMTSPTITPAFTASALTTTLLTTQLVNVSMVTEYSVTDAALTLTSRVPSAISLIPMTTAHVFSATTPVATTTVLATGDLLAKISAEQRTTNMPVVGVLAVVLIVGLLGNCLVIAAYRPRLGGATPSPAVVFILAMAALDVASCVFSLPYEILDLVRPYDNDNVHLCRTFRFLTTVISQTRGLLLLCVACDRYFKICLPLTTYTCGHARSVVLGIFVLTVALNWPQIVLNGKVTIATHVAGVVATDCNIMRQLPGIYSLLYHGVMYAVFAISFTAYGVLYGRIFYVLWRKGWFDSPRPAAKRQSKKGLVESSSSSGGSHRIGSGSALELRRVGECMSDDTHSPVSRRKDGDIHESSLRGPKIVNSCSKARNMENCDKNAAHDNMTKHACDITVRDGGVCMKYLPPPPNGNISRHRAKNTIQLNRPTETAVFSTNVDLPYTGAGIHAKQILKRNREEALNGTERVNRIETLRSPERSPSSLSNEGVFSGDRSVTDTTNYTPSNCNTEEQNSSFDHCDILVVDNPSDDLLTQDPDICLEEMSPKKVDECSLTYSFTTSTGHVDTHVNSSRLPANIFNGGTTGMTKTARCDGAAVISLTWTARSDDVTVIPLTKTTLSDDVAATPVVKTARSDDVAVIPTTSLFVRKSRSQNEVVGLCGVNGRIREINSDYCVKRKESSDTHQTPQTSCENKLPYDASDSVVANGSCGSGQTLHLENVRRAKHQGPLAAPSHKDRAVADDVISRAEKANCNHTVSPSIILTSVHKNYDAIPTYGCTFKNPSTYMKKHENGDRGQRGARYHKNQLVVGRNSPYCPRKTTVLSSDGRRSEADEGQIRRHGGKRLRMGKTTLMLAIVTLAAVLGYVPFLTVIVMRTSGVRFQDVTSSTGDLVYMICIRSFLIHNVVNPFVYFYVNPRFRTKLFRVLRCMCKCLLRHGHAGTHSEMTSSPNHQSET